MLHTEVAALVSTLNLSNEEETQYRLLQPLFRTIRTHKVDDTGLQALQDTLGKMMSTRNLSKKQQAQYAAVLERLKKS